VSRVKAPSRAIERATSKLPNRVANAAIRVMDDATIRANVAAMMSRPEFDSPMRAMLAGLAVDRRSRDAISDALDAHFAAGAVVNDNYGEVIVGAGLHASIYASVRARMGAERPLVVEASNRVGGVFAVSRRAAFYLNSRTRPGDSIGVPGESGSLNALPCSVLQPADVSMAEYPTNDVIAWIIRLNLAMHADVVLNSRVQRIGFESYSAPPAMIEFDSPGAQPSIRARRVIVATGLKRGVNLSAASLAVPRLLSFEEFMARVDEPFPLRGMDRVAVLGAGDSGRVVIEALCGLGPNDHMSAVALDWPSQIDWYGQSIATCDAWLRDERTRYKRIGALLRVSNSVREPRVRAFPQRGECSGAFDGVRVNGRLYDYAIDCTGFMVDRPSYPSYDDYTTEGSSRLALADNVDRVYVVGPAAALPVQSRELVNGALDDSDSPNRVALWRYADKTALLADTRTMVEPPPPSLLPGEKLAEPENPYQLVMSDGTLVALNRPLGMILGYDKNGEAVSVGARCIVSLDDSEGYLGDTRTGYRREPRGYVVDAAPGYTSKVNDGETDEVLAFSVARDDMLTGGGIELTGYSDSSGNTYYVAQDSLAVGNYQPLTDDELSDA
jgi:hypothetical protein